MNPLAPSDLRFGPGFSAFAEPEHYLRYGIVLVLATLSGALLAYHPVLRSRPKTVGDLEQQKTLIVYSLIGALAAILCRENPSVAFVIFGIGGLLRFRSDFGAGKHTGYTIIAALVGLCWGLGLELVGALATLYVWIAMFLLEGRVVIELLVGGVAVGDMGASAEAYREALKRAGAELSSHAKNFKKVQMTFVLKLPRGVTRDQLVREVSQIPEALRGTPDFPD
jgi:hypothetical protein